MTGAALVAASTCKIVDSTGTLVQEVTAQVLPGASGAVGFGDLVGPHETLRCLVSYPVGLDWLEAAVPVAEDSNAPGVTVTFNVSATASEQGFPVLLADGSDVAETIRVVHDPVLVVKFQSVSTCTVPVEPGR